MRVCVELSSDGTAGLDKLFTSGGKSLFANTKEASFNIELSDGRRLYIYGEVFYHIRADGSIKQIGGGGSGYLSKVFSENRLFEVVPCLEGQYIGLCVDARKKTAQLFSDRYARLDSFYGQEGADFYFATDLDFIFGKIHPKYDQLMLTHLFSVYGWYAPKGHTIYSNVKQLRVGEVIGISEAGLDSEVMRFDPVEIEEYKDSQLESYYLSLRDSVIARAGRDKTWISSSSGWDSSLLLGLSVAEFGPGKTGMVCGSMKYSDGTETINRFEIEKIKKIGKYFGIKPEIVEFDFKSAGARAYWEKVLPYYRSRHVYTFVTFNFAKLSDALSGAGGGGQVIFNGETADSFHNFGFSQFATFFHDKKCFTEYADKMNCYLYGPSFFKKVNEGSHARDRVYQIFKRMTGAEFDPGLGDREKVVQGFLFPLFYGSPRVPFARTYRNPCLRGEKLLDFAFKQYMPEVASSLTDRNIYSWLIYLYHSFHSQGSTVNVQKHAMEHNGHRWRSPFNDYRVIDILSRAPEAWGRGLDLNNTKYPLKWVARNRIRFPYEVLEEGPHSYLYDVIEGFSLFAEITYRSGVTEFFKETLRGRPYRDILSDEYFDLKYLDGLCADFTEGREARGQDFNNLVSLVTLCVTGWY